jgi:ribonucleoside-diphosphate reductase alpha chain
VADDLDGIYEAIKENALLSKFAGGLGNDWTRVRALGSHIKGTNGEIQGVVPFLKVVNDTAVAVNQGGKRKGAVCAYLETWHLDIEEFLELRKNTGDDRRRTHDMNTANWIPDLFMRRVMEGRLDAVLAVSTCPTCTTSSAPTSSAPTSPTKRRSPRRDQAFKTHAGHRPVAQDAVDAVRDRPPLDHLQGRLQRAQPAAARGRGALVQPVHRDHAEHQRHRDRRLQPGLGQPAAAPEGRQIDQDKLQAHHRHAMRMLDNVIDINYYAVKKARDSNLRHRPVGLGVMGFQDACTSCACPTPATRRSSLPTAPWKPSATTPTGPAPSWRRARPLLQLPRLLWDRGILPQDTLDLLAQARGGYVEVDRSSTLDWDALRKKIAQARHAQLQLRGHRAHGHHLQHHRRGRVHRAVLRQPVGQVQPVGRVHRHQRVPGARPQAPGPVGRRDGHGPQALRRLAAPHRPRARGDSSALYATAFEVDPPGWWKPPRGARSGSTRRSR